jgi:hypothetical protein
MNAVEEKAAQAAFFVTGVHAQGRLPSLYVWYPSGRVGFSAGSGFILR